MAVYLLDKLNVRDHLRGFAEDDRDKTREE